MYLGTDDEVDGTSLSGKNQYPGHPHRELSQTREGQPAAERMEEEEGRNGMKQLKATSRRL